MALATSSLAIRTDVVDQVDRVLGLLQPIAEEPDEWRRITLVADRRTPTARMS